MLICFNLASVFNKLMYTTKASASNISTFSELERDALQTYLVLIYWPFITVFPPPSQPVRGNIFILTALSTAHEEQPVSSSLKRILE